MYGDGIRNTKKIKTNEDAINELLELREYCEKTFITYKPYVIAIDKAIESLRGKRYGREIKN